MRHVYLISYDISDPARLRLVAGILKGYGRRLHYSVFRCDLTRGEYFRLLAELAEVMHLSEDRALLADLGPCRGSGPQRIRCLGRPPDAEDEGLVHIF